MSEGEGVKPPQRKKRQTGRKTWHTLAEHTGDTGLAVGRAPFPALGPSILNENVQMVST